MSDDAREVEFVPSTLQVRIAFGYIGDEPNKAIYDARVEAFDRWLADERAKAWEEGRRSAVKFEWNPYRET